MKTTESLSLNCLPEEVRVVSQSLIQAGFQAYLVGGCVRDLVLGKEPKDWDVATDASPEEIQKIFPESVYENQFGTVGVKNESIDPRLKIIEVTTFRKDGRYTDRRHPDEVHFSKNIEEDLARRDFTVNAMALRYDSDIIEYNRNVVRSHLFDPFGGQDDLDNRIIKTVGVSDERFEEDALRLMRAVRLATELDFQIDLDTRRSIERKAGLLETIARERIRDEFVKIIMSDRAAAGILLLEELDLLRYVIPELREGLGVGQNKHHIYSVFEHNLRALDYTARQGYNLPVRLASLLHDVGKPRVKKGDGPDSTFHAHEIVGAKMSIRILDSLRFSRELIERVAHLVRHHLFYYNVGEVTAAGVRRFLARVGSENIDDLMKVREADRIGSGVPKAVPYKLRHLLFMIEKVKNDPISAKMLKITGNDILFLLSISPGPKIGYILSILLEEVLDDPQRNIVEYLEKRVLELGRLNEKELRVVAKRSKSRKEEFEAEEEEEMKKKFFV